MAFFRQTKEPLDVADKPPAGIQIVWGRAIADGSRMMVEHGPVDDDPKDWWSSPGERDALTTGLWISSKHRTPTNRQWIAAKEGALKRLSSGSIVDTLVNVIEE